MIRTPQTDAVVTQNFRTVEHVCERSGHRWTTRENTGFSVVGGQTSGNRTFRTERAAQDHADFINKFKMPADWENMSRADRAIRIKKITG